jgi:hypothetical protein
MYNEKKTQFFEEFKLQLPSVLKQSLHLLFLISHVEAAGASKRIGFAFLPLIVGSSAAMIQDGNHALSVSSSFPSAYLSEPDQLKNIDKKPSFVVATRVCSALHPPDPHLRVFLKSASLPVVAEAAICNALQPCPDYVLVAAVPRLLNVLFDLVALQGQASVVKAAVEELLLVVERVTDVLLPGQSRCQVFDSYIGYTLKLGSNATSRSVVNLINATAAVVVSRSSHLVACRFAWLLLDAIVKQMFCLAERSNALNDDDRRKRFAPEFHAALEALVRALVAQVVVLSEE